MNWKRADDYMVCDLSLGTPPQNFTVMISSGGTQAWVLNTTFFGFKSGQHTYNVRQFSNITIKSRVFGAAESVFDAYGSSFPVDGALGLSELTYDIYGLPTSPMKNLLDELDAKVHQKPSSGLNKGLITLAGIDTTNCDKDIHYVPLAVRAPDQTYDILIEKQTKIVLFSFKFADYSNQNSVYPAYAYLNSAESTISLKLDDITAVYNKLNPEYDWHFGLYTLDCKNRETSSSLFFQMNGVVFEVKASEFILDLELPDSKCALAIDQLNEHVMDKDYLLGSPFIRSYCQIYNFNDAVVGFARSIQSN
ncbi:Peptidase A1 domain-containing protein [Aphelenchoides bicaudatus]|nr:Peptidase A1 domain-containing protein [Aphelenchoides bicaudatus]